jgi:hypothetical protein
VACPMPEAAPVTTMTWSVRRRSMAFSPWGVR